MRPHGREWSRTRHKERGVPCSMTKKLDIDVYAAYWNEVTRDRDRNSNLTRVFAFKGYLDATEAKVMRLTGKTKLAALP
ncbi:MAG: hypothetical protein QOF33_2191 [Thermomicrobiales bacterium]|nr:hypothetical protein [Thermomicrobiales bacterium]